MSTVSFDNDQYVADAMKLDTYTHVYLHLANRHAYNLMMTDGALVQFMYRFERRRLASHRLAHLPVPENLGPYNVYGNPCDGHLAEATSWCPVPVPLRIDYDASEGRYRPRPTTTGSGLAQGTCRRADVSSSPLFMPKNGRSYTWLFRRSRRRCTPVEPRIYYDLRP